MFLVGPVLAVGGANTLALGVLVSGFVAPGVWGAFEARKLFQPTVISYTGEWGVLTSEERLWRGFELGLLALMMVISFYYVMFVGNLANSGSTAIFKL